MKTLLKQLILFICFSISTGTILAQNPSKILLIHGYLHIGNGQVMESALIGIKNEKIILVRNSLAYTVNEKDWDTIIDLKGQHIYPGFVAPNSTLGLTEIDAVNATQDFSEIGTFNPHVRAQIAYNVESNVISTVRTNGVLITQTTPRGGLIAGSSAVMHLDGWNWEDATILADDGIHLEWPMSLQNDETGALKRSENYELDKRQIYQFFKLAKTYSETETHTKNDIRLEAMKNCFTKSKRVYIHANGIQQILDIIDFAKEFGIKYPVIVGGYDSHLATAQLKDAKIPVMLLRLHSLPEHEEDNVDLPFLLPSLLQAGGVKFCLQNEGDMEAMNARNLPFLAGTAKSYGLTEEQAIQSVSLSSCEILGIAATYGSIEEGKNATLFVSSGNALDMRTNNLILALIDGKFMSLDNSQKRLFKKYSEKYVK
jgi:imidazolonepropionase-like amidohydrolase